MDGDRAGSATGGAAAADAEIVAALQAGDEAAFCDLFRRIDPMMRRVARGYVASDAVAEEIVQETWAAVIAGIGRFEQRSALRTWILSILTNKAKTHGTRERRTLPISTLGSEDDGGRAVDPERFYGDGSMFPGHWAISPRPWERPERRLLSLEARGQLRDALARLPERQRLVVGLRDVEGLTAEEVCALLDVSQENQRVLLHRGRSQLRGLLEEYLDTPRA
jgi:RNA polymerase sigma-70 factor (ECF subfamily)